MGDLVLVEEEVEEDVVAQEFEEGVVGIFCDLAELFGNPRSVGAIYGLLFSSEEPLSLEEICFRLEISRGSASQGLRMLEGFGAVVREKSAFERHARFWAKMELKSLIAGFLRERVIPKIQSSRSNLEFLEKVVEEMGEEEKEGASFRLGRIRQWYDRADAFFPLMRRLLGE